MKRILLAVTLLAQISLSSAYYDPANPLDIIVDGSSLSLQTSRRVDHPNLRYALDQTGNLTNGWSPLATYKGDGSDISVSDASFSLATASLDSLHEALDFSRALDTSQQNFYRVSNWLVNEPIQSYVDNVDRTYVRLRSLDSDKFLYHDSGSSGVDYAADMDILDFRSHWFIRESEQADRYWIQNRYSGNAMLIGSQSGGSNVLSQTLLVDFGTDATYRGASVSSPDGNGNYWNEVGYSPATDMVGKDNSATAIDLVMTSGFGNDSYNGPAGTTFNPSASVFNAAALGDLGVDEAVYDYFTDVVTFELRDLDPAKLYNLTFYGSHKYNTANVTTYSVTDSGGTPISSVNLTIGVNNAHNQDAVVSISNVSPDGSNRIYVKFSGSNGTDGGYLNAMKIEVLDVISEYTPSPTGEVQMASLSTSSSVYRWDFHQGSGFYRIENAALADTFITVGTASTGSTVYAALDTADASQKFSIEPLPRGALLPWTSYDEDNYSEVGSGAQVLAPTYDRLATHSEAQKRSAVLLYQENAYIKWVLTEAATVFVLRYAIEDAPSGGGLNGTVSLKVRDGGGGLVESASIPVTSEQAWVYFDLNMNESDNPADGRPAKRFNEARVKLSSTLQPGYTLQLTRGSGEPLIWIDVVETELDGGPITVNVPGEYLDVTDYGAVPDDSGDDRTAFINCINAAKSAGKGVYIPAGEFRLSDNVDLEDVKIQGAGMWHTELTFTTVNGGNNKIGFWGAGGTSIVRDLYIRSLSTHRDGGGSAFRSDFGTGSGSKMSGRNTLPSAAGSGIIPARATTASRIEWSSSTAGFATPSPTASTLPKVRRTRRSKTVTCAAPATTPLQRGRRIPMLSSNARTTRSGTTRSRATGGPPGWASSAVKAIRSTTTSSATSSRGRPCASTPPLPMEPRGMNSVQTA